MRKSGIDDATEMEAAADKILDPRPRRRDGDRVMQTDELLGRGVA